MSATTDRAARRDLRRAVGEEGVTLLFAQSRIIEHQILPNLNAVQARAANIDERLHVIERRVEALSKRFDRLENILLGLAKNPCRTLWRWFWKGCS